MINEVSLQYAKSLYELSTNLEKDLDDLKVVHTAITSNKECMKVLMHPAITKEEKKDIFKNLLSDLVENYFLYFIFVLIDNERIFEISNILDAFQMLIDEAKNILNVEVVTKSNLTEQSKEVVVSYLEQKYHKQIVLKEVIDNNLIGGIKVIVGNNVLDASIDSTLKNLKNIIKG